METGSIKFFSESKGYGFIVADNGGEEIFVHVSGLTDKKQKVRQDDRVQFERTEGKKGIQAINVKRIE